MEEKNKDSAKFISQLDLEHTMSLCRKILTDHEFAVVQIGQSKLASVEKQNPLGKTSVVFNFSQESGTCTKVELVGEALDHKNYDVSVVMKSLTPFFPFTAA